MKIIQDFLLPFVIALISQHHAFGNVLADSTKKCSDGKVIRLSDLISMRTPNFSVFSQIDFPNYPFDCIEGINKDLTDLKKKWRNEDLSNWQQLSNQFCSYQDGWIEYNPGECSAGGPPPLCPVNHWFKDPLLAQRTWEKIQQEASENRLKEVTQTKQQLKNKACNCWAQKIDNNYLQIVAKKSQIHPSDNTQNLQTTVIRPPCIGSIPPGYKCVNGYLVPENEIQEKLIDKATGFAKDKIKDDLLDALKDAIPTFGKYYELLNKTFLNTTIVGVVTGVLESQPLGTYRSEYARKLFLINSDINKLEIFGQELYRLRNNVNPCLCRDEQTIFNEVEEVKQRLSNNVTLFNLNYQGALREDICNTCCPAAFTALTQKVNQLYADIMTSIK